LALAATGVGAVGGCIGTTGSEVVTFDMSLAGPPDATGGALTFVTGRAYTVTLTRARLHVGAVYLNRSRPISGGQERSCIQPGIYVGEVIAASGARPSGLVVDVLSPTLQRFPGRGNGTADLAVSGDVWLTGGDVFALDDPTVILDAAGEAVRGDARFPFDARFTIGKNRFVPSDDPARPGANPICKQRIAGPVPIALVPRNGGELVVRIDPRAWFSNVDFDALPRVSESPLLYRFEDTLEGQPTFNLYRALLSAQGVFSFSFESPAAAGRAQ
jgi:hypothetical protein